MSSAYRRKKADIRNAKSLNTDCNSDNFIDLCQSTIIQTLSIRTRSTLHLPIVMPYFLHLFISIESREIGYFYLILYKEIV